MSVKRSMARAMLVGHGVKPRKLCAYRVKVVVAELMCKKHHPKKCKCYSIPAKIIRQKSVPIEVAHKRAVYARKIEAERKAKERAKRQVFGKDQMPWV